MAGRPLVEKRGVKIPDDFVDIPDVLATLLGTQNRKIPF